MSRLLPQGQAFRVHVPCETHTEHPSQVLQQMAWALQPVGPGKIMITTPSNVGTH